MKKHLSFERVFKGQISKIASLRLYELGEK